MAPANSTATASAPAARLSQLLAWACLALAFALPVLTALALWRTPPVDWLERLGIGADIDGSSAQVTGAAVLSLLPVLVLSYALLKARRCLAGLARGDGFAHTTVTQLRAFAGAVGLSALLGMLVPSLASVLLSWQAGPGQRALAVSIDSSDLLLVLFAGIVWQIASVLARAAALAEEHAQIV